MAEKNNIEKPSKNQDSSQDPPLQATSSSSQELKKEKQGTIREFKRRKSCPTALHRLKNSLHRTFPSLLTPNSAPILKNSHPNLDLSTWCHQPKKDWMILFSVFIRAQKTKKAIKKISSR